MLIGYARVSTDDQKLNLQHDALQKAGCEKIFEDYLSGAKTSRTGLDTALDMGYSRHTRKISHIVKFHKNCLEKNFEFSVWMSYTISVRD